MTVLTILSLGFFLGMRHATDADHVVAVTTILSRERSIAKAALVGVLWGIGHTLTLMLVGGAIVLFGLVVPEKVGMSLEFAVAIMLVVLGIWNVKSFMKSARGSDKPSHDHEHTSPLRTWKGSLRTLFVGVVHGLAGSAAVALLVLPLVKSPVVAVGYLLIFGLGTIVGMMLITSTIAIPVSYSASRSIKSGRYIAIASSALSIAFGLFLVYQIGFVDGLFLK